MDKEVLVVIDYEKEGTCTYYEDGTFEEDDNHGKWKLEDGKIKYIYSSQDKWRTDPLNDEVLGALETIIDKELLG